MKTSPDGRLTDITEAWQLLESHLPMQLRAISDEFQHRRAIAFMNALLDEIGDNEQHQLIGLLDTIGALILEYEDHALPRMNSSGRSRG